MSIICDGCRRVIQRPKHVVPAPPWPCRIDGERHACSDECLLSAAARTVVEAAGGAEGGDLVAVAKAMFDLAPRIENLCTVEVEGDDPLSMLVRALQRAVPRETTE